MPKSIVLQALTDTIVDSFWHINRSSEKFDLIVIGAGLVGLCAAIEYRKLHGNARILVVERGSFASGASMRNAGFACFGSPSELLDDIAHEGETQTIERVNLRWQGLQGLRQLIGDEGLGISESSGFELFSEADNELYTACSDSFDRPCEMISPSANSELHFPFRTVLLIVRSTKKLDCTSSFFPNV